MTQLRRHAGAPGWPADRIARALQGPLELPQLDFPGEDRNCSACGGPLRSCKRSTRILTTLAAGTFRARALLLRCPRCTSPPRACAQLAALAPPGQRYGYDLICWVGLQRYHRLRQRSEIRECLARRGIRLSDGSVSALCDRFLHLLGCLHRRCAPALRAAMRHGYPLHLDATCDQGRGGLFLCLDGWRGWVLHAARIRSESAAELQPALQAALDDFGPPVAFVRDLGSAMAKAVAACRIPTAPDLVCHFHFLAAVGGRLLDADHAALRRGLALRKVRSGLRNLLRSARRPGFTASGSARGTDLPALLYWVLEGDGGRQPRLPFGLPHLDFYRRCLQFRKRADERLPQPRSRAERRILQRAAEVLEPVRESACGLPAAAQRLERSQAVFATLRDLLRLRHDQLRGRGPHEPLSAAAAAALLDAVAEQVRQHRRQLRRRVRAQRKQGTGGEHCPEAIVLDYLDRYRDHLFGHPLARDGEGRVVAVVERTNNPAEHFFSQAKRELRRRLGRAHLGRDMQDQPAQVALTANLHDPDYVRIVCGTLDGLPRAFAELVRSGQATARPALDRYARNDDLRRRVSQWSKESGDGATPSQPTSLNPPKVAASNRIVTR